MPSNLEKVQSISRIAGADFSGSNPGQYRFVIVAADGTVTLSGAAALADGILLGKQIAGHAIEVGIGGRLLVVAGAAIVAGQDLSSDANSAAIPQASTAPILGTALESGAAGDIISVLWAPKGAP